MKIENAYHIGEAVQLVTDPDHLPRMVTGINIRPGGLLVYQLSCGIEEATYHYEIEIKPKEL